MIVFITSLRHPRHSNSYRRVLQLLDQTLDSVCNQTSPEFSVIVVCNEDPPRTMARRDVHWVVVDFPPPCDGGGPRTGMDALRLDRGTKYIIGLANARELKPDHIMFFDADDFVSNRLAAFTEQYPYHPGWYILKGYVYDSGLGHVGELRNFHQVCGTSHIVNYRLYDVPVDTPLKAPQTYLLNQFDHEYVFRILGSHRWLVDHFAQRGTHLEPLPFPGAVYYVGHGENHTAQESLWTVFPDTLLKADPALFDQIRNDFTIPKFTSTQL